MTSGRAIRPVAEEVFQASPRVTWTAALQAVTDEGLPLRTSDIDAGQVETEYVDVTSYQPEASQYPLAERLVRFRVLVAIDPEGDGSRLGVLGIYSPFSTGLSNTRRSERAIPRDHPAMEIVRSIVRRVREQIEGG